MSALLRSMIISLAIFESIYGFTPGFTELYKGIEENENEYDGAMKITVNNFRPMSGSKFAKLWENAVVPYEISNEYSQRVKDKILDVMEEFHKKTCVRFRPRKGEASHIFLEPGKGGCSAIKGKIPNRVNKVWLGFGCIKKGVIMHELMHALGFIHEQNRPDRDNYVRIDYGNIDEGEKHNFKKYREGEVYTFDQPYDYGSIMHYGPYDFARDFNRQTVIPLQKGARIGQGERFSKNDLIKINLLYNCTGRTKFW